MTNSKSTKRALVSSALAILMCVAMLIGTTFAWFTDTASTGVNKIQAGNLEIEVEYTLDGEEWAILDEAADLFGDGLFEPGYTRVVAFRISNKGNLALKYNMSMNLVSETKGVNKAGEEFALSDYLKVKTSPIQEANQIGATMVAIAFDRDYSKAIGWNPETNFKDAKVITNDQILSADQQVYFIMQVYMPETVGNEANAISADKTPSIDFGISFVATQATVEKDSFDNQYDKDAGYAWDGVTTDTSWYNDTATEFYIKNGNELAGISKLAGEGETFKDKKITLTDNIDLGNEKWVPIKSFEGEFDGNGKTISGLRLDSTEGDNPHGGLFNDVKAGSKIYDLKIDGVEATVGENVRFGVLGNYIRGEVENIEIKNVKATSTHPTAWVGGMCAFMSWPAIKDCTVENMEVNAPNGATFIAGFSPIMQKNADFTFENCNVKNFKVNVTGTSKDGCGVGGFVGQTQRGWEQPKMLNCHVTGIDITAAGNVDIGGFMPWPGGHTIAENCSASGKIDATGVNETCRVGGFFGNLGWNCDLGQMGHNITNCTADVDIVTKNAPAGGFVGTATNINGNSMYATFNGCKALGDVICVEGGTASIGGFAGVADRGYYENCSASGTVSGGAVNGGFIGTVKHIDAKYDSRYPVGTRDYDVEQITVVSCNGTAGSDFIGMDDQSNKDSLTRYHEIIIK